MSNSKLTTTLLVILDGWGVPSKKEVSAITPETAPNFYGWHKKFPYTELEASGEAVGLFKGQAGNSEAGHLNIGAGRIVKQDALYVSDAIEDGTFFKNIAFQQAIHHVKKYNTAVHIMGLLSNHNSAHSRPEHLYALLELCKRENVSKVYLHLFTDGRDSGPHDAHIHLQKLREHFCGSEKIASIMGRLYAMDRNKNWDRIEVAYDAIVSGIAPYKASSAEEAIDMAYKRGESDEFIVPTLIAEDGKTVYSVNNNDVVFFFNLRSDRARQLTKAIAQADFEKANPDVFVRSKIPENIRFVAMTDFGPELNSVLTAFPSRDIKNGLVQTLCPHKQLYIAETEKYAHITYFLNGGYAQHFCDEQFVKIESDPLINYSAKPEMKASVIADYIIRALKDHRYEFIAVNFANADMVGHTGDIEAAKKAIKTLDFELGRVVTALLKEGGRGIITADHGNAEYMVDLETNKPDTEHSTSKVPCFLIVPHHEYKKFGIPHTAKLRSGSLSNVAPTVLKLMNIDKPKEMVAKPLF